MSFLRRIFSPDPLKGSDEVVADRLRSLALKAREQRNYRACDLYSSAAVMVDCGEKERARATLEAL